MVYIDMPTMVIPVCYTSTLSTNVWPGREAPRQLVPRCPQTWGPGAGDQSEQEQEQEQEQEPRETGLRVGTV